MTARFQAGDAVRVRPAWPEHGPARVHIRTPGYLRGRRGVVERALGAYGNPEELAFGKPGLPQQMLYRVVFSHDELWAGSDSRDGVAADIYEHWLEPAAP
jgi:nitrile hydratase